MKDGFIDDIKLTSPSLFELKQIIRASHAAQCIYQSIDGLYLSQTAKLCGIYTNNTLASFAWHMKRTWSINDTFYTGLSIGVVTTVPGYRNRGYAKSLIEGFEKLGKLKQIDFLYLAGIPGFYSKYGFKGFAPKSKLVFNRSDLPLRKGSISSLTKEHLTTISHMYAAHAKEICAYSSRTDSDWQDLLGPLSSTFLFNNPSIILDHSNNIIAYFCATPNNPRAIREFITLPNPDSAITALSLIAHSAEYSDQERLEIFTPAKGPIWDAAANSIGADFLCFLRPQASNMIKWISSKKTPNDFHFAFIFQGDNL